ncbi:MAG: nuclear transport factor 2 family protein [Thermoleophilaceae bacterium]|nr:nuclear transport factor 2 family protein [Thermoleophilaceae bacterium]
MSQENVETIKRIYASWAKGDFSEGLHDLDSQVQFLVRDEFPEPGMFVGPTGVASYMRVFLQQWEHMAMTVRNLRPVGDTVVAAVTQRSRGKASGIEGALDYYMLFTFRGGKILRIETVMHEADALEAVGLSE